jgi:hypothetical protein
MAKISIPQSVLNLHPGMLKYILSQFEKTQKVETLGESVNNTKRYIVEGSGVPTGYTPVDIVISDLEDNPVQDEFLTNGYRPFKHMLNDRYMGYWR